MLASLELAKISVLGIFEAAYSSDERVLIRLAHRQVVLLSDADNELHRGILPGL